MSAVRARGIAAAAAEVLAAVGVATGVVALLKPHAPASGLGVIYLLAVLLIAIRRGLWAALAASVLSVLLLNYFFFEPLMRPGPFRRPSAPAAVSACSSGHGTGGT